MVSFCKSAFSSYGLTSQRCDLHCWVRHTAGHLFPVGEATSATSSPRRRGSKLSTNVRTGVLGACLRGHPYFCSAVSHLRRPRVAGHPRVQRWWPDARTTQVSALKSATGTRAPYSATAGRVTAPGDPRGPPRGLVGPQDLTVPGVAFRHPRSAISVPGRTLACRLAPHRSFAIAP
jgi:hypothetical protein